MTSPSADVVPAAQTSEHSLHGQAPEKIQRSLFGEILDWMLAPLLLLWPMSIAITYLVAKSIANQPFDRALEDNVLVLSQQVKEVDGKILAQMSNPARDILRADDLDNIYFQIKSIHGELVDGDRDLPLPAETDKAVTGNIAFRNDRLRGVDIRVAYGYIDLNKAHVRGAPNNNDHLVLIQVAETLEKRAVLANEIIKGVILPQFIILPIALALVWFALSRGLSPLAELQQRIRARKPDDLSPIDSMQVPEEITPLVRSLNEMLERLAQTISIQKRFIADAAHQMKTPLAGMRMQSELALRQTDHEEIHRSLLQLSKSSEAATRLINQLLTLARAENPTPATKSLELIDLADLARSTVQDWIQASFANNIDLGIEQTDDAIHIFGNAIMLRELLSNLIDNAIRYTPKGHSVTVRTSLNKEQALAVLEVEDNGPGIPASERAHIFERFYRILGSNVQGSGLGLSIVREIAQQHDARIEITDNPRNQDPQFPGCLFRISFKINPHDSGMEDLT
ncbi:MAG: sensor histidine kinase N-terminal domain-containing protein [Pseudomonadota bacterium]